MSAGEDSEPEEEAPKPKAKKAAAKKAEVTDDEAAEEAPKAKGRPKKTAAAPKEPAKPRAKRATKKVCLWVLSLFLSLLIRMQQAEEEAAGSADEEAEPVKAKPAPKKRVTKKKVRAIISRIPMLV